MSSSKTTQEARELVTNLWFRAVDLTKSTDFSKEKDYTKARENYLEYSIKEFSHYIESQQQSLIDRVEKEIIGLCDTCSGTNRVQMFEAEQECWDCESQRKKLEQLRRRPR